MTGKARKTKIRGQERWYVDGTNADTGKRKRWFFRTKPEAEAKQLELNKQAAEAPAERLNPRCDPDVRVRDYGDLWLTKQTPGWRPGTARLFRDLLRLHVYEYRIGPGERRLGDLRVREWTRTIVPAVVEDMAAGGYAKASMRLVKVAMSGVLTAAVDDELLRSHPIDVAVRNRLKRILANKKTGMERVKAFTQAEAKLFLAKARETSPLFPLYAGGFLAGCRIGELTALQLDDDRVVVANGARRRLLRVERTLTNRSSMLDPKPGPTKGGGAREIDVSAELGTLFDAIKAERPKIALRRAWRPVPKWMFVTGNGTPYSHGFVRADFERVLKAAGLQDRGFSSHSMRHSFAALHILEGRSPKWVQQQMGHSSARLTLDVYADWFRLHDQAAADGLAGALLGNTAGNRA